MSKQNLELAAKKVVIYSNAAICWCLTSLQELNTQFSKGLEGYWSNIPTLWQHENYHN